MRLVFPLVVALASTVPYPLVAAAAEPVAQGEVIEMFSRPGCPYCEQARAFLDPLDARRDDVTVVYHNVIEDGAARERLQALAREHGIEQLGVPAILIRGQLLVGWGGNAGERIEYLLAGEPPADGVEVPLFGAVDPDALGLPLFTLVLGLVDGFNPCAMWVLLFLLSLLVNLRSRKRMAAIGGVFVGVSGLVYFVFMAAWLNLFLIIGASRPLQIGLGVVALAIGSIHVKDFFAHGKGVSLSIPESAKPGIYARARAILQAEDLTTALILATTLAVMVNLVEFLCSAGLPAVYTQVLMTHGLPTWQYYALMALYILAYMFDDAIMLTIAVITLSKRKLQERGGRVLKLVSGAVMMALGALLVLRPEWLSWQ